MLSRAVRGGLLAALIICLFPAPSPAAVRSFSPVAHSGSVVVFRLAGVHPLTVKRAHLRRGPRSVRVPVRRVRRGAARGRVHLRVPRKLLPRRGPGSRRRVFRKSTARTSRLSGAPRPFAAGCDRAPGP
jgi:hypothetical protein